MQMFYANGSKLLFKSLKARTHKTSLVHPNQKARVVIQKKLVKNLSSRVSFTETASTHRLCLLQKTRSVARTIVWLITMALQGIVVLNKLVRLRILQPITKILKYR